MNFTSLIDAASLGELLSQGSPTAPLVILDCRFDLSAPFAGRQAYAAGHLPGAHYADLNQDLSAPITDHTGRHPLPAADVLAGRFSAWGIGDGTQVVAYDGANGSFAARAWWLLRWLGHSRVAVLNGGFKAWVARGGALETSLPPQRPAHFTPRVAFSPATSAEVARALRDRVNKVIDARAAERYAGAVEPIDPVAGHVPGAINRPFSENVTADGLFLAPADLRRRWEETLAGTPPANTIHMCGSGVTACHNLLALEAAGLPGAALYAGSWSEWIRDPKRPVRLGNTP